MESKEIALVLMVAGLSSRFGGRPKQFAVIGPNQETLIEYSLNQALKTGFTKIIFIVGNKTESLFKEKFGDAYKNIPIKYAYQMFDEKEREKPWGSLDAVCSVKEIIKTPFVVCNGDDIYGENTFKTLLNHLKSNKKETATVGFPLKSVIPEKGKVNRGIFQIDEKNNIISLTETIGIDSENLEEKKTNENDLCSMNIFALFPKNLSDLQKILSDFKEKNKGNKIIEAYLPTAINELIKSNKTKMKIYPAKDKWYGITNPEDEETVRKILKSEGVNRSSCPRAIRR